MIIEIDNPCYHCYTGAIGECRTIGCKYVKYPWSKDLEADYKVDYDMTDKEIGVIIKPIFVNMVNSKFFAYECGIECYKYGIECYKKGMEYRGIKELTIENDNLIKQVRILEAQMEKLINFVLSKTECCDVCPITDTCINSEGTCPYAGILAKGEEEVIREWLMQFISKEIKEK